MDSLQTWIAVATIVTSEVGEEMLCTNYHEVNDFTEQLDPTKSALLPTAVPAGTM